MKKYLVLTLLMLTCLVAEAKDGIQIYFSPKGGCTEAIIRQIAGAKRSIQVQAYSFTSAPIAKALVEAHNRGVKVEVILDKSQQTAKYSSATFLKNNGVPTFIDKSHSIAHNKVIVVDRYITITGSFNFSKAAEEDNAENLVIIPSRKIAGQYIQNFEAHKAHSH